MAEDECLYDLDMLDLQLQCLLGRYSSEELQKDSKLFCSDYFELVKEYTTRWHVPVPQLRILEKALCYFTEATTSLTSSPDHLLNTLSSLALSIYELLLFFDANNSDLDALKQFTVTFQECYAKLKRHQNVYLQQVACLIEKGGPWAGESMQAILSESSLAHNEVDKYLSSELPVFFELRIRYLLSCERITEALALAKCCAQHPATGQHLFFLQTYLTWLHKTSQHDRLQKEVADFSGKDAVHTIFSLESEETDETLLALCRAFLSHQLKSRDMQSLCDLVFIWSKLHNRLNTPKQVLIEESLQLMSSSTDVLSIFPFIRALTQELGEQARQFCVEICARALQSCLPHDVFTKSLLYKTIAGLLQNDLEVCRACALLVFFMERSVEAYKLVYVLYMHPDQEYHVDHNPIQNHIRFETLQVLKKDLHFDPEFWNLFALRTNCLALMSDKVVGDALKEIMEEKWITSYCQKLFPFGPKILSRHNECNNAAVKKHQQKVADENTAKKVKVEQSQPSQNLDHAMKRRKKRKSQTSKFMEESSSEPLRRSFWQLDRRHSIGTRRTTRFSERMSSSKRRIRQPKWLLEDSGSLEENIPSKLRRMRRQGLGWKKAECGQIKNDSKRKLKVDSDVHAAQSDEEEEEEDDYEEEEEEEDEEPKEFTSDCETPPAEPQILELSLPDNELPGPFAGEVCQGPGGRTPKPVEQATSIPEEGQPVKAAHGKEVVLRARDLTMLVQLLHCYGRRQKGNGSSTNVPGSVSTITRSSVQASPPKTPPRENGSPVTKSKPLNGLDTEPDIEKKTTAPNRVYSVRRKKCEPVEEPAVEINVSIASQTGAMDKLPQRTADLETNLPPNLNNVSQTEGQDPKRPPSPCKEVLPRPSGELQCPLNVKATKEQVENLPVRPDVTHAEPSEPTLEQNHHKVQASPQTSSVESRVCNAQNNVGATTSLSTSGNPKAPPMEELEASDNDMDPIESGIVSEESRLEFLCTSCEKVFKGSRVVEHAMFHFRRDECMFCWTTFKDDLLAMMHMSDHIEKLKKAANKTQDGCAAESKSVAAPKASSKSTNPSNDATGRRSGMLRSSSVHHKTSRPADQHKSKVLKSEVPLRKPRFQRRNGHVSNKNSLGRRRCLSKSKVKWLLRQRARTQDSAENHSADNQGRIVSASGQRNKNQSLLKENENVRTLRVQELRKDTEPKVKVERSLEKVHCPAEGCSWTTDLTKNRVALLYHALEKHRGDKRPLELSFEVANSKCSICMRVLWSFEHFQHHVERHRLTPRHPCLHQGCTARFKSGMEMRRHARMHDPLQARCCRPGCSKLFICLWALNLHEKDHYCVKSSKESRSNSIQDNDVKLASTKKESKSEPADPRGSLGESSVAPVSPVVLKTEVDSEPADKVQTLSASEHTASSKETSPTQEKNLDPSKTLKALSSFLLKHRFKMGPNVTKNSAPVSRRKQGRPSKRKEEESSSTDSESVEKRPVLTKTEDVEVPQVDPAVRRRRGRPCKVKGNVTDSNRGDVKEEADDVATTGARLEDRRASVPGTTDVQKRGRGRPPKLRRGTNCVKDEAVQRPKSTEGNLSKEPVVGRKRGRPRKIKREMHLNKQKGGGSETGRTRDERRPNPSIATRFKNKWQAHLNRQVRRKGRIGFNIRKAGHDCCNVQKKKGVKPGLRVTDKNVEKVVTQQERSTPPVKKEVTHKKEVPHSTEVVQKEVAHKEVVHKSSSKVEAETSDPDAKSGLAKKRSIEVVENASLGPSQSKKPHVEEKATSQVEPPEVPSIVSAVGPPEGAVEGPVADPQQPAKKRQRSQPKHGPQSKKDRSTICVTTLMEYGKKPYLRPPPTAYLDEKFTNMPRRKKEMLDQHMSQTSVPEPAVASQQRHRCSNCFAMFNSAGELQQHRQQSCSNLFGFDSDEEGNG